MLAVFESATCNQNWHVFRAVIRGIAQVAGQQYRRVVQQRFATFFNLVDRTQKVTPRANDRFFDAGPLPRP